MNLPEYMRLVAARLEAAITNKDETVRLTVLMRDTLNDKLKEWGAAWSPDTKRLDADTLRAVREHANKTYRGDIHDWSDLMEWVDEQEKLHEHPTT